MLILEDLKEINDVIKELAEFIQNDEFVKPDFEEYIRTVNGMNLQSACFNYIFERNLDNKSILTLYLENTKKVPVSTKKIVKALMASMSSIFEVKRVLQNGFDLNNIINEKNYSVVSLVKMTSFRGIGAGQYVVARIFKFEKAYYLLEISGVLPSSRKDDALRYSVAKIIQNPELVYFDNPEKQKEIEKNVKEIYDKFIKFFGKDEVVTTNKFADDLIGAFNDFAEGGEKIDIQDKIQLPETYKFFDVSEFNNSYDNFLENSLGGFSSHKETYDVGIIFDKELGLYAVPFFETFNKIFENFESVENAKACVEFFLQNDKFSANIIKRVAECHENFMDVVNKLLNANYTLEELLQHYKSRYLENKIFSSTTVLYKSKAFSKTLGIIEEDIEKPSLEGIDLSKIGRNDPCPCGSGKKFKKCCGANL
jgi:protein translocase subunit secA